MPYIPKDERSIADDRVIETPGALNYTITMLLIKYLKQHNTSYRTINDCIGALESAKLEMYRRVAVPYETEKIATNGDVY